MGFNLVWINAPRGPQAQIWDADFKPQERQRDVIIKIPLTKADDGLSIETLRRLYPCPLPPPSEPKTKLEDNK